MNLLSIVNRYSSVTIWIYKYTAFKFLVLLKLFNSNKIFNKPTRVTFNANTNKYNPVVTNIDVDFSDQKVNPKIFIIFIICNIYFINITNLNTFRNAHIAVHLCSDIAYKFSIFFKDLQYYVPSSHLFYTYK